MAKGKYSQLFALLKEANAKGLGMTYQELVEQHTNGETKSLSSLSDTDVKALMSQLRTFNGTELKYNKPGGEAADRMRKGIIAVFRSLNLTADDAAAWTERYGVYGQKKPFNDYNKRELWQLIRNAEQFKEDHLKSLMRNGV